MQKAVLGTVAELPVQVHFDPVTGKFVVAGQPEAETMSAGAPAIMADVEQ